MRRPLKRTVWALVFCTVCAVLSSAVPACAENRSFELTLDRDTVELGDVVELRLTFSDTQSIPAVDIPSTEGYEIRYRGPSTMMSIVNGTMSSSITHLYTLIPQKTGTYTLGPVKFSYKNDTYSSPAVTITITDGGAAQALSQSSASQSASQSQTAAQKDSLDKYIFLTMSLGKKRAYVNEQIPVTIQLYVTRVRLQDIQYPVITHEGISFAEFNKPKQYQRILNGVMFEVLEFTTTAWGTRPGSFVLGPTEMECNLIARKPGRRSGAMFDSFFGDDFFEEFFGRAEVHPITISAPKQEIEIVDVPEEGKPASFTGSLGNYTMTITAQPLQVRVGDPVTVTMTIEGTGNLTTVQSPQFATTDGFKMYDAESTQEGNRKVFEQVIIPTSETITEIPSVSFSFFNTEKGSYETLVKGPLQLTVSKPEKHETVAIVEPRADETKMQVQEVLGKDIVYIKEHPGRWQPGLFYYQSFWYWCAHGLVFFLSMGILFYQRKLHRLAKDERYARKLSAPKKARKGIHEAELFLRKQMTREFYDSIHKTLSAFVSDALHVPIGNVTSSVVEDHLRKRQADQRICDAAKNIFDACDRVRYAPHDITQSGMEQTLQELKSVLIFLER